MNIPPIQSTLAPAAANAAISYELGLLLYLTLGFVFLLVMALTAYAMFSRARPGDDRIWIIGGGLLLPVAVLSVIFAQSLRVTDETGAHPRGTTLRVHAIGRQWWWEIRYEMPNSDAVAILANELRLPVGQPVEIVLTTNDVIHSFWVPSLAGKVDMIPGRRHMLVLTAAKPGVYRGQCAEYCGLQHALMAFFVVAQPATEFRQWLAHQARPALEPADPFLARGRQLFFAAECDDCHTIRGTAADGDDGPDLTHVGSRLSLGGGILDNHPGTMAGWIAGTQDLKPGVFMPSMNVFAGEDLRAVAAYLSSLR
jgi:cytochrome c oxidase subunit II